jgi:hypothetical protein
MVGANDRVVVTAPYIVDTRFEFNDVVDVRPMIGHPIHSAHNSIEWETSLGIVTRHLLEHFEHAILIETAVAQVRLGVGSKLELTALLGGVGINSGRSQALKVTIALFGIDYVHGLIATIESVLNERQQNAVFFFVAVKERTNMTDLRKL